ncbi:nucleoside triphosphate hydrolase [Acetobacter sp.]|jgi:thymidylate kinase|uniref:nucleoside triphosphate hydrolase n=1 Tax=Acetobacter sp. TaxID=440 RepID=UPI0025BA966C|nr:nucleoside triphosphate hydrolase [Acetobacter sp.]MCH4091060.1 nucleoside triphosphate hydrolase [Acetobacter sp.]MCI1300243.1 nucleoside triphosphate hydrolase [Acetobacter sp.]MCI1316089.1 nucleoside triphosphate hydrolase [Acetobacter sp.]
MAISGPIIAVVGSDGSGKSTVGTELLAWMRETQPTALCHLGKQSGELGRAIARLPFVGRKADRRIVRVTSSARQNRRIGFVPAVVMFALSMRRVIRFRRMLRLHRQGVCILTDRYPQVAVPGPMDGPSLTFSARNSAVVQFLTMQERGLYDWMASIVPDLVIRLNVDIETAIARKPDHRQTSLERKIADVPRLSFNGAPILDLDATEPLAVVLEKAKNGIREALIRHQAHVSDGQTTC